MYFIGEIGINHNGDMRTALELIYQAKVHGIDCVKFQKRNPDVCVPEDQKEIIKDTIFGKMKYIDYKHRMEFNESQYKVIDEYCKQLGIKWTASVWDIDSLHFLAQFDIPFIKVPSACLTHYELLKECAIVCKEKEIDLMISTGMSTEEEIIEAVRVIRLAGYDTPIVIFHCNSSYPTKDEECNLLYIERLKQLFPHDLIGYSGHEDGYIASALSYTMGANIIERHITLDKKQRGSDHAASLDMEDVKQLMRFTTRIDTILGDGQKIVYESEKKNLSKLRYFK